MPVNFFICPMIGDGTRIDPRRGKYQRGVGVIRAGQLRFGRTEDAIVMIEADQAYLDTVAADPECQLICDESNIDTPLTAPQVTAIQNFLEARGVPADWLQVGETRRQTIRGIAGMFLFSQRMEGRYGMSWKQKAVAHGVTLASEWQVLPVGFQTELVESAQSFGWTDITGAAPTTTLRQILKSMGNRFQNTPIFICSVEI